VAAQPFFDDGPFEVRHVQPYQATKRYRCPGCDHEIEPGTGHEVVVPVDAPDLRRHWHTPCWAAVLRRRDRARERRHGNRTRRDR
jgi:hypothetical protein